MHLVDDVHFVLGLGRHEHDFVTDPSDIVYAVVTRGVHLDYVEKRTVDHTLADLAFVAGIAVYRVKTVDGTGKNFRNGGLAGSSCSTEKIGMTDPFGDDRLTQSGNGM